MRATSETVVIKFNNPNILDRIRSKLIPYIIVYVALVCSNFIYSLNTEWNIIMIVLVYPILSLLFALLDQYWHSVAFKVDADSRAVFTKDTCKATFQNKELTWKLSECKSIKLNNNILRFRFPGRPKYACKRIGIISIGLRRTNQKIAMNDDVMCGNEPHDTLHPSEDIKYLIPQAQRDDLRAMNLLFEFFSPYFEIPKKIDLNQPTSFKRRKVSDKKAD